MRRSMASFSMVSNLLNFLRGAAVGGGAAGGSSEGCDAALPECRPTWGWSRAAAFRSLEELLEFLDATSTSTRAAGDCVATLTGREAFLSRSRCGRRRRSSAVRVRCGFVCAHGAPPPPYPPPPSPPPPSPAAALSRLVPRLVPRLLPRCAAALAGVRALCLYALCAYVCTFTANPTPGVSARGCD